jgi:glycosyltransferase involved in cell wall biosynthesis
LVTVRPLTFKNDLVRIVEPNAILLVHYEQQLVPVGFVETLRTLRARGVRVVFCCHWYLYNVLGAYRDLVDAFVVHRPYGNQTIEIPLGCPIYEPETGRLDLRARLGFQPDDIVVTTLGFLSQWKKIPATLEAILSKAKNSRLVFQIQTPRHFSNQESEHEEVAIRAVMAKYPQVQTRLSTDFLPEKDLLDRVYASDLGFVFHGQNTDSVSAANKQFVSARCPLVITESTHGADLKGGVVRVPGFDVAVFAAEVLRIAQNADLRDRLRGDMADEYARINMDVVAEKYMELLGGLT